MHQSNEVIYHGFYFLGVSVPLVWSDNPTPLQPRKFIEEKFAFHLENLLSAGISRNKIDELIEYLSNANMVPFVIVRDFFPTDYEFNSSVLHKLFKEFLLRPSNPNFSCKLHVDYEHTFTIFTMKNTKVLYHIVPGLYDNNTVLNHDLKHDLIINILSAIAGPRDLCVLGPIHHLKSGYFTNTPHGAITLSDPNLTQDNLPNEDTKATRELYF